MIALSSLFLFFFYRMGGGGILLKDEGTQRHDKKNERFGRLYETRVCELQSAAKR